MASYVPLVRPDGSTLYVNPDAVDAVEDAASVPGASFVSFTCEGLATRETVVGSAAVVTAALAAGGGGGGSATGGQYAPALATAPVAPLLNVFFPAPFTFHQIGKIVTVWGRWEFNLIAPGVAFVEIFTPPGLAGVPSATTGGGAASCLPGAGIPTVNNLGAVFKGIGITGALRFEVYDPTGLAVGPPATVNFSASYELP